MNNFFLCETTVSVVHRVKRQQFFSSSSHYSFSHFSVNHGQGQSNATAVPFFVRLKLKTFIAYIHHRSFFHFFFENLFISILYVFKFIYFVDIFFYRLILICLFVVVVTPIFFLVVIDLRSNDSFEEKKNQWVKIDYSRRISAKLKSHFVTVWLAAKICEIAEQKTNDCQCVMWSRCVILSVRKIIMYQSTRNFQ